MNFTQNTEHNLSKLLYRIVAIFVLFILESVSSGVFRSLGSYLGFTVGFWIHILVIPVYLLIIISAYTPFVNTLMYLLTKMLGAEIMVKYRTGDSALAGLAGRIALIVLLIAANKVLHPAIGALNRTYPHLRIDLVAGVIFLLALGGVLYTFIREGKPLLDDIAGKLKILADKIPGAMNSTAQNAPSQQPSQNKPSGFCWNCGAGAVPPSQNATKICVCGTSAPANSYFCPNCGKRFPSV